MWEPELLKNGKNIRFNNIIIKSLYLFAYNVIKNKIIIYFSI